MRFIGRTAEERTRTEFTTARAQVFRGCDLAGIYIVLRADEITAEEEIERAVPHAAVVNFDLRYEFF